jgi:Flp pilus assembly protein CpaB
LAQRDLSLGQVLDVSDVRVVSRPAETVPIDAVRAKQDVNGRVLRIGIFRDDVIRAVDLAPLARNGLDGLVPVGRRAVHVVLKDGFRPRLGAVVDVLASADPTVATSSAANVGRAVTVAQGAIVVGLDDPGEGSAGGSAVTVLVTEAEAPAVAFAAANGQVTIALAPPEDACCTS